MTNVLRSGMLAAIIFTAATVRAADEMIERGGPHAREAAKSSHGSRHVRAAKSHSTAQSAGSHSVHVMNLQGTPVWLSGTNAASSQPAGVEGALKALTDGAGITPFVWYYGDFLANPSGGKIQTAAWYQTLEFGGEISFERYGWKGASMVIAAEDATGQNLSKTIGNILTVAQTAQSVNTIALSDLYLKQKFGDNDFLEFHLGRLSPEENFAILPIEAMAVNAASTGNPISLTLNTTLSDAWGAYGIVKPSRDTYAEAGVYQADPRSSAAYHGMDFSIRGGDGTLMVAETGWTPTFGLTRGAAGSGGGTATAANPGLPGNYQFGSYYSNYTFASFQGGNQHNAFGFYLQGQQMVWRQPGNPDFNLTLWGGVTYSPQVQISTLPVMGFGGVKVGGLIPGRGSDSLFMNFYIAEFSPKFTVESSNQGTLPATSESVLEWGYVVQLTDSLAFQPDMQYVIRPYGTGTVPNAFVIGFQVAALFQVKPARHLLVLASVY